jgi:hypothetical protein
MASDPEGSSPARKGLRRKPVVPLPIDEEDLMLSPDDAVVASGHWNAVAPTTDLSPLPRHEYVTQPPTSASINGLKRKPVVPLIIESDDLVLHPTDALISPRFSANILAQSSSQALIIKAMHTRLLHPLAQSTWKKSTNALPVLSFLHRPVRWKAKRRRRPNAWTIPWLLPQELKMFPSAKAPLQRRLRRTSVSRLYVTSFRRVLRANDGHFVQGMSRGPVAFMNVVGPLPVAASSPLPTVAMSWTKTSSPRLLDYTVLNHQPEPLFLRSLERMGRSRMQAGREMARIFRRTRHFSGLVLAALATGLLLTINLIGQGLQGLYNFLRTEVIPPTWKWIRFSAAPWLWFWTKKSGGALGLVLIGVVGIVVAVLIELGREVLVAMQR